MRKAADVVVTEAEHRVNERARSWFRPPHALEELEFLIKCTRCGDCIEACPVDLLLFPLPGKYGAAAAGTPAMDLLNKGCLLCRDQPCVAACEPGALLRPPDEGVEIALPRLALAAIDEATCLPYLGPECGACADSCPVPDALLWDGTKPRIDAEHCVGCGLCREACVSSPNSVSIVPIERS